MLTPHLTSVFERLRTKERRGPFESALLSELVLINQNPVISEQMQILSRALPPGPVPTPSTCGCCGQTI
jgi:hypothetical protein